MKIARRQTGLSYTEVLAAIIVIALAVIPATEAIRGAIDVSEADTLSTTNQYWLRSKLEEVLADSLTSVAAQAAGPTTASTYSDSVGTANRRLVFIATYDGDNADTDDDPFTGTDPDLLWVRVEIEGSVQTLQALKSD